jgi:hypothetical protein
MDMFAGGKAMGTWRTGILLVIVSVLHFAYPARSQELGQVETFGSDGRQFSSAQIDYYLLTRQRYVSEDSSGYQGDVRAVKKFPGGGYEIVLKRYIARCSAPVDNQVYVSWSNPGEESNPHTVSIKNPGKFPGQGAKESYNLFWAACRGQYRKFK